MKGIDWFTDRRLAMTKEPIAMHVQRLSVQLEVDFRCRPVRQNLAYYFVLPLKSV